MGSITVRVRSVVWFVTGALLATTLTLMFVNAWRVDAAPGDTDATLVAITPCRLADTRPAPDRVGTAGTLGVAATQTLVVHGSNGQCTIPTDAVAVSLNVTAVGATEPSFLTFWPEGVRPLVSSLNPTPGEPPTPNAVTVDLSGAGGFNVYNLAGSVNVVIDVNGYYTNASLKQLAERLATSEARLATTEARLATVEAAQPFAVTNRDDYETVVGAEVVVSVAVTAPVAGQVVVNSTASANETSLGDEVRCSITTGTSLDGNYYQWWESSGTDGDISQLAGTRMFEIKEAGTTVTYNLVCDHLGASPDSYLTDSVLTAIFTPAP